MWRPWVHRAWEGFSTSLEALLGTRCLLIPADAQELRGPPALPLTNSVIFGKLPNFSELQFPLYKMEILSTP